MMLPVVRSHEGRGVVGPVSLVPLATHPQGVAL